MKLVCTIEARMTSSRLPGKVLLPAAGKPMLQHLLDRLKQVEAIDEIIIATTTNATDDVLADFASEQGVGCFRGSEDDVLARVVGAGESVNADVIVTITGDCPIIDYGIVSQCIKLFQANPCDYASNVCKPSYPIGMDVQVMKFEKLKSLLEITNDAEDREHVTWYIRNHPESYDHLHLIAPDQVVWPELGLTLDEEDDYLLLKAIIEYFDELDNPLFSCEEVVKLMKESPELVQLNAHVKRKT